MSVLLLLAEEVLASYEGPLALTVDEPVRALTIDSVQATLTVAGPARSLAVDELAAAALEVDPVEAVLEVDL